MRVKAKEDIDKIMEENRKTFNSKRKEARKYDVGDVVAIAKTQFDTGAKLKKKFYGPYKISEVHGNDRYNVEKVEIHEGLHKTSTSADNVKPWGRINMMRKYDVNKQLTISIEGNIGSGKSTLLKYFKKSSSF